MTLADRKTVVDYEIIDHGVTSGQYFQGCGIVDGAFDDVATGVGDSADKALENALEQLAQQDWNTDGISVVLSDASDAHENCEVCFDCAKQQDPEINPLNCDEHNQTCELYHFVSVLVKGDPS